MKYLLIILLFSLTSCAQLAHNKINRKWRAIQRTIEKHPELADSLKTTERDTVAVLPFNFNEEFVGVVDTAKVDSMARIVANGLQAGYGWAVIKPMREKLATAGCPTVKKDTTYMVKILNGKVAGDLPVRIRILSIAGKLSVDVSAPMFKMPKEQKKITLRFDKVVPFYRNDWFWVAMGVILVVFMIVLLILRR